MYNTEFKTNIVEDPLVTLLVHSRCTLDTYPDICGTNCYPWYLRGNSGHKHTENILI